MKHILIVLAISTLAGCADQQIEKAEERANKTTSRNSMVSIGNYADQLSKEYLSAAARVSGAQDAFAFLTLAAAGSVVVGAAGTTSDAVLAKRGVAGAMSSQLATRTSPKAAIQSIYQASKQLNCIATIAKIGDAFGVAPEAAAITLTQGAIDYVRISARERVVRDVADYSTVLGSLNSAVNRSGEEGIGGRSAGLRESAQSFDEFAKLLAKCTASNDPKPSVSNDS
jgi:hypothetical protein